MVKVLYKTLHVDKNIVTKDAVADVIVEQIQSVGISPISDGPLSFKGTFSSYRLQIIETDGGYKVSGTAELRSSFYIWVFIGFLLLFVAMAIPPLIDYLEFNKVKEALERASGEFLVKAEPVVQKRESRFDGIKKLAELRDAGALTDEEFAAEKKKLLAG